jgi:6-phosphogluconolactonase
MKSQPSSEIIVLPDRAALAREAAARFVALAQSALATRGEFSVALSGGATPRDAYDLLASPEFASRVDWARIHFFWGDERAVPPDHPDSNYRMAYETLLARIQPPARNVHRIRAELAPADAAREYEEELQNFFQPQSAQRTQRKKENPATSVSSMVNPARIDLILLGLGADGHTASLFPHTRVLHERTRWVAAEYVEELEAHRITLTVPIINAAKNILWLVAGEDKAQTVREVLRGAHRPDDLPAQLIRPRDGRAVWLLDRDAAAQLTIGN